MCEDIRIWKIEDSSKAVSPLEPANRMETEHALEELLVASPGMLLARRRSMAGRSTYWAWTRRADSWCSDSSARS